MILQHFDDAMSSMASSLADIGDLDEALRRIVFAAVQTVPGAEQASISVRHADDSLTTAAGTDRVVYLLDELQYELREGPCYDAVTVEQATYSRDLSRDPDWPRFGPRAAEMGMLSQMAVRLVEEDGEVTGLNLYAGTRNAFEDSASLAQMFASHARVALGYASELQSLRGALGSRETIGKAVGIAMERYGLSDERAFEFLIRLSTRSNTKLRDLAQQLVDDAAATRSGEMPLPRAEASPATS